MKILHFSFTNIIQKLYNILYDIYSMYINLKTLIFLIKCAIIN